MNGNGIVDRAAKGVNIDFDGVWADARKEAQMTEDRRAAREAHLFFWGVMVACALVGMAVRICL